MTATDHRLADGVGEGLIDRLGAQPDPLPTELAVHPKTDDKGHDWVLVFDRENDNLEEYIRAVSIEHLEDWR